MIYNYPAMEDNVTSEYNSKAIYDCVHQKKEEKGEQYENTYPPYWRFAF